jgi:hypothetical protein
MKRQGIKFVKNSDGKPVKMVIDLKKWRINIDEFMEYIKRIKHNDSVYPFEKVLKDIKMKRSVKPAC